MNGFCVSILPKISGSNIYFAFENCSYDRVVVVSFGKKCLELILLQHHFGVQNKDETENESFVLVEGLLVERLDTH